jgi:hypothetical protein
MKNEPAFPYFCSYKDLNDNQYSEGHHGMTLRDWFAGQALNGMMGTYDPTDGVATCNPTDGVVWEPDEAKFIAQKCYLFADAMLKEREK